MKILLLIVSFLSVTENSFCADAEKKSSVVDEAVINCGICGQKEVDRFHVQMCLRRQNRETARLMGMPEEWIDAHLLEDQRLAADETRRMVAKLVHNSPPSKKARMLSIFKRFGFKFPGK